MLALWLAVAVMAPLVALAPGAAVAQVSPGGTIREIRVEGNQRIEPATVRSYLTIREGDPFDPVKVDESLKALFSTGLFADITAQREGDVLVFTVVENPIINRLAFEGNRRLSDEVLEQEVQLRPRTVYTRSRVQSDVQRLLQVYRRSGRFAATIDPKVVQLPQNRVDLIFEIDEGPVTGVQRIDFIGNETFSDSALRDAIATKESRWYRFLTSEDTYDPDRLTLDRELLRRFYLSRGYADFRVVSAVAELTRERDAFFITFTVEEGERYNFGKVELTTTLRDLDPEALRAGSVTTRAGDVYNAEAVEETVENLTFAVGERGYAFVDVRPRVNRNREARTIDVVYEINEGPRVYVERIDITGNVRTLDRVIRREFRLSEGDAFNTAKIRRSRQRIRALGFFDTVEVTQSQGSAPDRAVINVDVRERSTGELSFGVGFSSTESVVGDVSLRERNLLGRGQDLRLSATLSGRRQQLDLSFTEPYFLERNVAAGFDLFSRETDYQDRSSYDEENLGGRLRTSFPITEHLRQGLNYMIRQDEISDVDPSTSDFIRQDEGSKITSAVGYDLVYDWRDDRFLPNEGYVARLAQQFAGLGGDSRYILTTGSVSYYYPFAEDYVGNLSLSLGHIAGLGEDVRVTDRFFLGGDNFRGFETGGLGPRDALTDDSLGGNMFYVATAEMRFPLGLGEEYGIYGRAFTEAGTLAGIDVDGPNLLDTGSTRVSVGVGLSWESPFGPIRIDLAQPVVKEDFDQDELLRFSFGTRF